MPLGIAAALQLRREPLFIVRNPRIATTVRHFAVDAPHPPNTSKRGNATTNVYARFGSSRSNKPYTARQATAWVKLIRVKSK